MDVGVLLLVEYIPHHIPYQEAMSITDMSSSLKLSEPIRHSAYRRRFLVWGPGRLQVGFEVGCISYGPTNPEGLTL